MTDAPRRLLLMRHAKASSPEGVADHARPLSDRGRRDAEAAGRWLASQDLLPQLVVLSDSTRTEQTVERVVHGLATAAGVPTAPTPALYDTSVERTLDLIAGTPADVGVLLLVGHEPTTSATVAALTGRTVSFPTAAVAVVALDVAWPDVAGRVGTLLTVWTPHG